MTSLAHDLQFPIVSAARGIVAIATCRTEARGVHGAYLMRAASTYQTVRLSRAVAQSILLAYHYLSGSVSLQALRGHARAAIRAYHTMDI